jgi:hypothetical protein
MNTSKEPDRAMIGNKALSVRPHIKDDKYLSAILKILDEEMDLLAPRQVTVDQSDELDLLVADLMKQIISGPDPQ